MSSPSAPQQASNSPTAVSITVDVPALSGAASSGASAGPTSSDMALVINSLKSDFESFRDFISNAEDDLKPNAVFEAVVQIARRAAALLPTANVLDFIKEIGDVENQYIAYFKLHKFGGAIKEAFAEIMGEDDGSLSARAAAVPPLPQKITCSFC